MYKIIIFFSKNNEIFEKLTILNILRKSINFKKKVFKAIDW